MQYRIIYIKIPLSVKGDFFKAGPYAFILLLGTYAQSMTVLLVEN